ncbi:MAG TPA: amidohydrolase family protein [Burkholderiales bacterium]|jgi:imidazolonepropionase-like amidohydrolase|nr:amidohydrolase family protein [Burkholderiales bacterium]
MQAVLFTNVRVLDGSGAAPFPGEVRVQGERIAALAPAGTSLPRGEARVVDGRGATLMPGLIEAHAHLSFTDVAASIELGSIPPEEHTLLTARNARRLLDAGFTGCFSAASAKPRLDVVVRNAINAGEIPGPRLLAASPELTVTAGLGDVRLMHLYRESYAVVCDGAEEFRRYARLMCREGVDTLKVNVSGDAGSPSAPAEATVMTDAEVAAVCEVAAAHGKRVAAHARSAESVKMCLRHGIDVIYHATLIDEQAKDLLEARKDRVFVAPAIGHLYTTVHEAGPWGITPDIAARRGLKRELELAIENMRELKRRGVRILPGGDYGFAWNPNGSNARDLEHFVRLLGFSPMEAIVSATRLGALLMGMGDRLGQIRPGYLADLLLIEGDPLQDIGVLRDGRRRIAVMKGGAFHCLRQ